MKNNIRRSGRPSPHPCHGHGSYFADSSPEMDSLSPCGPPLFGLTSTNQNHRNDPSGLGNRSKPKPYTNLRLEIKTKNNSKSIQIQVNPNQPPTLSRSRSCFTKKIWPNLRPLSKNQWLTGSLQGITTKTRGPSGGDSLQTASQSMPSTWPMAWHVIRRSPEGGGGWAADSVSWVLRGKRYLGCPFQIPPKSD